MGWLRERKENERGKGCRGGITNISFAASCTLLRCVGQSECNKSEWNIIFILFTLPTLETLQPNDLKLIMAKAYVPCVMYCVNVTK